MALERKVSSKYRIGDPAKGEVYHLKICDHIMDNIYGQIGLTEIEKQIERLPIFKRLHSISQLGLVNWIFPCALHTRYTHSIGVMHIAGLMADHINQNMEAVEPNHPFFDDDDRQIIRLAGMLHDIGHYPLSHNVEQAYKNVDDKKTSEGSEILENLEYYNNCPVYLYPKYINGGAVPKKAGDFNKRFSGSKGLHHENVGKMIIQRNQDIKEVVKWNFVLIPSRDGKEWILNPKFWDDKKRSTTIVDSEVNKIVKRLLLDIGNMVIGNYQEEDGSNPWNKKYSAMVQIIHSDMDADNLDYLLRDATFSGTSYGVMDMGVLLNSLTVGKLVYEGNTSKISRYIVGVRKKGLGSVEQFFFNKFLAYTQMIFSKYTSILEAMLLRFEMETVDSEEEYYNFEKLGELLEKETTTLDYLKFSDYYIFEKIFDAVKHIRSMSLFPKAAVSHLWHSCAFDLEENESECLCTGTDIAELQQEMLNSEVYKRFAKTCEKAEGKFGSQLREDGGVLESELLSYRFEQQELTKQIPLEIFMEELRGIRNASKRNDQHYYRFGTGVPILTDGEEYKYDGTNDLNRCKRILPQLSVDCPQSSLHKMHSLRYVSLRQYKVREYNAG